MNTPGSCRGSPAAHRGAAASTGRTGGGSHRPVPGAGHPLTGRTPASGAFEPPPESLVGFSVLVWGFVPGLGWWELCLRGSPWFGCSAQRSPRAGRLAVPGGHREVNFMVNPLQKGVGRCCGASHPPCLSGIGSRWGWDGQEQPWAGRDCLCSCRILEPGGCREGFLFHNSPCMVFTVFVSRGFS